MKLKIGSLCCGIGGIDLGFIEQGFDVAWAVDIDKKACETYNHNFGKDSCSNFDLATLVNDEECMKVFTQFPVDIITAGFPCQGFSIAGEQKGFDHEQGNVFFDVCKIIERLQPKAILLENVKNILSHDKGRTITIILDNIRKLGYHVISKIPHYANKQKFMQCLMLRHCTIAIGGVFTGFI